MFLCLKGNGSMPDWRTGAPVCILAAAGRPPIRARAAGPLESNSRLTAYRSNHDKPDLPCDPVRWLGHALVADVAAAVAQAVPATRLRALDAAGHAAAPYWSGRRQGADRRQQQRASVPGSGAAARDRHYPERPDPGAGRPQHGASRRRRGDARRGKRPLRIAARAAGRPFDP